MKFSTWPLWPLFYPALLRPFECGSTNRYPLFSPGSFLSFFLNTCLISVYTYIFISLSLPKYQTCKIAHKDVQTFGFLSAMGVVCPGYILRMRITINPLNAELNPICYLLALLGAHHFLHVSRIRVKLLTFRLLMSYTYGAPILDVSRSHTTTHHSR